MPSLFLAVVLYSPEFGLSFVEPLDFIIQILHTFLQTPFLLSQDEAQKDTVIVRRPCWLRGTSDYGDEGHMPLTRTAKLKEHYIA